jgi:hypothetical protein
MINRFFAGTILTSGLALLAMTLGCDGDSRSPSAPSPGASISSVAAPSDPPLSVMAVSPQVGSNGGHTSLTIAGAGIRPGATVTLGGATVEGRLDWRDPSGTIMYVESPAHPAGTVDVVVTNPDGKSGKLAAGYTYASPESFDFNGYWSGFGDAGQDIPIAFTIENNVLTSVSCDTYATLTFSPPLPVSRGGFSFSRDDGVAVAGGIVSASQAVGTIELAPCTATRWRAGKQ